MNLSENDYHAYPAWSHSLIARYAREGFSAVSTIHEPVAVTPSMEFGSLVDTIMTKSRKEFEDEYVIDETGVTCPPAEREVFDKLLSMGIGDSCFDDINHGFIFDAISQCDTFCSKYKKDDTRLAKLCENKGYYDLRRTGKKVVSKADFNDAVEMAKALWTSDNTRDIFRRGEKDGVEYIYQAQFMENVTLDSGKEILVKIMPDLLIVDHNKMTIQPVDLKTSSVPGWQFKDNFIKFRYDLQAEMYTDVINMLLDKDANYRQYDVLPYIFADISRTDKIPVTYVYDPKDGFSFESNGREYSYKGWMPLLEEMLDYEERQAKVPSYISLTEPNDIISIISR